MNAVFSIILIAVALFTVWTLVRVSGGWKEAIAAFGATIAAAWFAGKEFGGGFF
jgi:hypothetical protein